jgi:ABC-type transporter Mla subunit MlaD
MNFANKNETGSRSWSGWLPATKNDLIKLMAKVSDAINAFRDQVSANFDRLSTDLGGIKTEITDLNTLIQTLQNSTGELSAEDQATLDAITAKSASLVSAADALTVPAVPPAPAA